MAERIETPADCEIRAVIRFLQAKNIQPADIHRQVCEVYGEGVMSDSMVRRWCRQFESGRDNVHDDKHSGRPSVVTSDLVQQIKVKIRENRRFTITDLAEFFPNVSRKTVHRIVIENRHFRKLCARWVPKNEQAVDFFDIGIRKLVTRYNKCLDSEFLIFWFSVIL
jgi:transposase